MLKLMDVNDRNWLEVRNLSVSNTQAAFLDSAVGILARLMRNLIIRRCSLLSSSLQKAVCVTHSEYQPSAPRPDVVASMHPLIIAIICLT